MLCGSSIFQEWREQADVAADAAAFPEFDVVNAAVGGTVSGDWLTRLPGALERHDPAAVGLYVGSNDLNAGVPPAEIVANLRTLRDMATHTGRAFVWFGVLHCPQKRDRADVIDTLHDRLRGETSLCDLSPALSLDGEPVAGYFQDDGVHLTRGAYARLAAFVLGRRPFAGVTGGGRGG